MEGNYVSHKISQRYQSRNGFMKIRIIFRRPYGKEMFYPADDWTREFISVFRAGKVSCFSRRQVEKLKELGFEIEMCVDQINI